MRAAPLLTLAAALAAASAAAGGVAAGTLPRDTVATVRLPPARPGAVITTAVPVPAALRQRAPVRFTITVAPTVRLFGPAEGLLPTEVPDRIPLTFTLPRDQAAGPLQVARIRFVGRGGAAFTTELVLDIVPVRHISLRLSAADEATSSRPLVLHTRVANAGNALDTVELRVRVPSGWRTPAGGGRQVLSRGDTLQASYTVEVPREVPPGAYSVTLTAAGRGDTSVANATFRVREQTRVGGWSVLPATLFVGAPAVTSGPVGAALALDAFGSPSPGTTMSVQLRRPAPLQSLAFNRFTSGPEVLLQVSRPDWRAAAGEVFITAGPLPGVYATGVGAEYSWSGHTLGELDVARPHDYGSALLPGHLVRGSFAVPTPLGQIGIRGADFLRPLREGSPSDRTQSGTLLYDVGPATRHLLLEGGYGRVQTDSGGAREGAAFRGELNLSRGAAYLTARLRRLPAVAPGDGGTNESSLGAGVPLFGALQLLGWGVQTSMPVLGSPERRFTAASGGLRAAGAGASLDLRGNYNEAEGLPLLLGQGWTQRTLSAHGHLSSGRLALDLMGERGTVRVQGGVERPLWNVRGHAGWSGRSTTAWLGLDRTESQFGPMPLRIELGGSARVNRLELDAGAGAFMSRQQGTYLGHVWSAAAIPLLHGTAAVLGTEYQPWMPEGGRMRLSVGFKADLALPVPVPGRPAARGVVFEDRNADGRWQEGEPVVTGVGLNLGSYTTSTDPHGRFAFPNIAGLRSRPELQVDLSSLPLGWMVGDYSPSARTAAIPLVRAGSLRIRLISEEHFGPDSSARPAANLPIDLVDGEGRQRSAASDSSGTIVFRALPPGSYTLTIYPVGPRGQSLPIKVIPLELGSGASRTIVVPVPTRPVEIRFKTPPAHASSR